MSINPLRATVEAIAESDNDLGGLRLTRLNGAGPEGATTITVESALGWPSSGKIGIEGVTYNYTGKTAFTFTGITHTLGGTVVNGLQIAHPSQSVVVDLNKNYSAVGQVRRSMLVNFAEGEDLNVVGRNLGVLRLPFITDDEVFRDVIKATAYNPKGTVYGLELALDALVGDGNYEIFEDIPVPLSAGKRNTVLIRLTGAAGTATQSQGKAFPADCESVVPTSDTELTVSRDPMGIGGVHWKNEDHVSNVRAVKPSAISIEEYEGDPGTNPWAYKGADEAGDVTSTGDYTEITDSGGGSPHTYEHLLRIQPESTALMSLLFSLPSTATIAGGASDGLQWGVVLQDTDKFIAWGVISSGASTYDIGFIDSAGAFISGAAATLTEDIWYQVDIRKNGQGTHELVLNGTVVQTLAHSSFSAGAAHEVEFGAHDTTLSGMIGRVKAVGYFVQTLTDYWNSRGTAATTAAANPTRIDTNVAGTFIDPDDLGKEIRITGATVANAQGGNNNGTFLVDSIVSGEEADLVGRSFANGEARATGDPSIFEADDFVFQFPDDLGKTITITGATNPANNGTFTIDVMYLPGTTTDLESFDTSIPQKTNRIAVVGTPFVAETGLAFTLDPVFVTDAALSWELAGTGSNVGSDLTLRNALPITTGGYTRVLDVCYTDVFSAQILENDDIENVLISELPLLFEYYPFYIHDPLGFIRSYLDALTAAGVIPEIEGV